MDSKVAQEVLGHTLVKQKNGMIQEGTEKGVRPLAAYSKDMNAAWELAEKLGITLIPIENGSWFAFVGPETNVDGTRREQNRWKSPAEFIEFLTSGKFTDTGAAVGDSAPVVICIAALKAAEKRQASAGAPQATAH